MILSFSDPRFEARIKAGIKIHTIREDKHNRWKQGMSIQFWMHNPRNVSKNPYQFGEGVVLATADIEMNNVGLAMYNVRHISKQFQNREPFYKCEWEYAIFFANNDGFDTAEEMKAWFKPPFKGKLIYWTNCKWY